MLLLNKCHCKKFKLLCYQQCFEFTKYILEILELYRIIKLNNKNNQIYDYLNNSYNRVNKYRLS